MDSNRKDPPRDGTGDRERAGAPPAAARDRAAGAGWWVVALLLLAFSTSVTYCTG